MDANFRKFILDTGLNENEIDALTVGDKITLRGQYEQHQANLGNYLLNFRL